MKNQVFDQNFELDRFDVYQIKECISNALEGKKLPRPYDGKMPSVIEFLNGRLSCKFGRTKDQRLFEMQQEVANEMRMYFDVVQKKRKSNDINDSSILTETDLDEDFSWGPFSDECLEHAMTIVLGPQMFRMDRPLYTMSELKSGELQMVREYAKANLYHNWNLQDAVYYEASVLLRNASAVN